MRLAARWIGASALGVEAGGSSLICFGAVHDRRQTLVGLASSAKRPWTTILKQTPGH